MMSYIRYAGDIFELRSKVISSLRSGDIRADARVKDK